MSKPTETPEDCGCWNEPIEECDGTITGWVHHKCEGHSAGRTVSNEYTIFHAGTKRDIESGRDFWAVLHPNHSGDDVYFATCHHDRDQGINAKDKAILICNAMNVRKAISQENM